ncbi:hypothetical protein [Litchfieldia salsa]|uniref:Uncharacterized protein n=1 Tax=Litchfieldia salsa TaxID=930152 RepID=A0A1H0RUP4_9BACI|nr:hypothetical protein [Litchfieldia salsa]SDP33291.1 hypothetical protein SAMN05216565_102397 [Litchfieldia salsa]
MFDILLDFNNLYSIYSIYFSMLLGITIKVAWKFGVDDSFISSLYYTSKINVCSKSELHFRSQIKRSDSINQWISKVIRRKVCPNDDGEEVNILPVC